VLTQKFPVLHYGNVPHVDLEDWRLKVWGLVEKPREWTWRVAIAILIPLEHRAADAIARSNPAAGRGSSPGR
jgi:DMSO/TMAO reductase YedYZ molybdopterin-dependent catalytic subunit